MHGKSSGNCQNKAHMMGKWQRGDLNVSFHGSCKLHVADAKFADYFVRKGQRRIRRIQKYGYAYILCAWPPCTGNVEQLLLSRI